MVQYDVVSGSVVRPVFQHLTFGFCLNEFRVFPMISVGEHSACWALPYKEGVGGSSPSTPTENYIFPVQSALFDRLMVWVCAQWSTGFLSCWLQCCGILFRGVVGCVFNACGVGVVG